MGGKFKTETTPEGEQSLAPGVAPVTERERLEARMTQPKTGKAAPCNHGLFDLGARDQAELF